MWCQLVVAPLLVLLLLMLLSSLCDDESWRSQRDIVDFAGFVTRFRVGLALAQEESRGEQQQHYKLWPSGTHLSN